MSEDSCKVAHHPRNTPPITAHSLYVDRALIRARRMRALTTPQKSVYTRPMTLSVKLYESLRRDIEAEFEARKRELEDQRREAVRVLNEAWPKMGGSTEDLASFDMETALGTLTESSKNHTRKHDAPIANGSYSRTVPMKTVRQEVDAVMSDERINIVTQSEIKARLLEKYPDAKVPSIRSAISHFLSELTDEGELDLMEKGRAGSPNKYRKTRGSTEALELGP